MGGKAAHVRAAGDARFGDQDPIGRNQAGEPFSRHRIWQYLQVTMDDPLEEVVAGLVGTVKAHLWGAEFEDDFTVLAVERADPPA